MVVSASPQPVVTAKRMATNSQTPEIFDYEINNPGSFISFPLTVVKETPSEKSQNKLISCKIFPITLRYKGQPCNTNVLKVTYQSTGCLYKVVLSSSISYNTPICWLHYQPGMWAILLGNELDDRLQVAITAAIMCQEEPGLF
jgi:hypothetical protein